MLDQSHYSYTELRKAYLRRVQHLHPDRYHNQSLNPNKKVDRDQAKKKFVELQEAWSVYERYAKVLKQSGDADASFTMFGVGCSFSDNDRERDLRSEITDQACRGWFSSGVLHSGLSEEAASDYQLPTAGQMDGVVRPSPRTSLCDDDLFILDSDCAVSDVNRRPDERNFAETPRPRPSLIVRSMLRN
jgi:curved DNA-binding protein CbpA